MPVTTDEINAFGIHQSSHQWRIVFNSIPGLITGETGEPVRMFSMNCIEASTPGMTIEPMIHENKGTTTEYPGKFQYDRDLAIVFTDNETMDNWQIMYSYMIFVKNHNSKSQRRHVHDLYTTVTVIQENQAGEDTIEYEYKEVWPMTLSQNPLNSTSQELQIPMTFKYQTVDVRVPDGPAGNSLLGTYVAHAQQNSKRVSDLAGGSGRRGAGRSIF